MQYIYLKNFYENIFTVKSLIIVEKSYLFATKVFESNFIIIMFIENTKEIYLISK